MIMTMWLMEGLVTFFPLAPTFAMKEREGVGGGVLFQPLYP